jgi:sugar phosphate isomerase/epimerase
MMDRRDFLAAAGALSAGTLLPAARPEPPRFRLGTVTYNIAAGWDLDTLIRACKASGFEAVELRTTHAHKVEPALSADERREVKKKFADGGVLLWGLGSVCEFHAPDPAVVRKNVETCRAFCVLAADIGARGVKVRPNALPKEVEPAKTLEQIGKALAECGRAAADLGVEVWLEVHGGGTSLPENIRAIMDHCGHKAVGVCWNSNVSDVKNGSVKESFDLLKKDIRSAHITDLKSKYPYRELFAGLRSIGYDRVTLMEWPGKMEPEAAIAFMKEYRALWMELASG